MTTTTGDAEDGHGGLTTSGKSLPPPNLSIDEIDRFYKTLTTNSNGGKSSERTTTALKGRKVLVPAFGNIAFYEGELAPKTVDGDEIVYVSTPNAKNSSAITSKKTTIPLKEEQQYHAQKPTLPAKEDITPMRLSETIEWLKMNSSFAGKSEIAKATTKMVINDKEKMNNSSNDASISPSTAPKKPILKPSSPITTKPSSPTTSSTSQGPMFNINEEYSADGRQIMGEAVNLSTRLKAVYGDQNPKQPWNNPESKTEAYTKEEDGGAASPAKEIPISKQKKQVSDQECDRISKRLEELALMEEEEAKRVKEGKKVPLRPLGGGAAKDGGKQRRSNNDKSSFGFKKGFLNNSSNSNKSKSNKKVTAKKTTVVGVTTTNANTTSPSSMPSKQNDLSSTQIQIKLPQRDQKFEDEHSRFKISCTKASPPGDVTTDTSPNKIQRKLPERDKKFEEEHTRFKLSCKEEGLEPSGGGVKIDLSKNKVHEIPREGRQMPIPKKQPPQQDQKFEEQYSRVNENNSRLLHSSVFSGQISERNKATSVISADVAKRVAANEQTQSLQHELAQQQRQTRTKRVSRFKQERQQEQ